MMGGRRRDRRQRFGHSLLGVVGLVMILLTSYVASRLDFTPQPPPADWTCAQATGSAAALPCLDINYGPDAPLPASERG